jgi:hypothetical protein
MSKPIAQRSAAVRHLVYADLLSLLRPAIEKELAAKYGSRLSEIAGFYFMQDRWRLNLPRRCLLFGYAGRHGFYNGILCQPIDHINAYFLMSSAKHGGAKAIRLEERDRLFFESYKEPIVTDGPSFTAELRHNSTEAEISELIAAYLSPSNQKL